jgi:endoglucanase
MKSKAAALSLLAILALLPGNAHIDEDGVFVRVNQLGYPTGGAKVGIAFGSRPIAPAFQVVSVDSGTIAFKGNGRPTTASTWGHFSYHLELDFSALRRPGSYRLRVAGTDSATFAIDPGVYGRGADTLLEFMRQQRCGYNPFLDSVCHPLDGRSAFGPMPDGSYVDARGGWHDAGDSLKYLLTSSNAVGQMLLAYRLAPSIFGDRVNASGLPGANGQADVLDEARWGLEWMLRLHPAPEQLFHQVGDDRDHSGWRLPQNDQSDYGWGKGGYRVVYFATGRPQGLREYKSDSTGIANLAGRYAAAMAIAYDIWRRQAASRPFAEQCLRAGAEVYRMGRRSEGVQQGNSYGAPYRYAEETWADDMEWGAAELYRVTREPRYLSDAKRYARLIGSTSWIGQERIGHYQFYPFVNVGHFELAPLVEPPLRKRLAGYYREGLEKAARRGASNPYTIGVPFIWCSNNLTVALATLGLLFERLSADGRYRVFTAAHRDWLFGRNPWGTSMFTGVPDNGVFPRYPHLIPPDLTGRPIRGGLVDGPVGEGVFTSLKGISLSRPDSFAPFQSVEAVYHDDMQDYSSNEPTMDGTASAILLLALLSYGQ